LSRTAAAVFVITHEDIRRSGMTTVADLLRLVPGLDVAQINASNWAIGSRGFNGRFADTLLVLIDGRSLYSPDFAGVFWQVQQLMLEDIERIEVIRGPGAAIWGVNAVTGVINIVTKKAKTPRAGLLPEVEARRNGDLRASNTEGRMETSWPTGFTETILTAENSRLRPDKVRWTTGKGHEAVFALTFSFQGMTS